MQASRKEEPRYKKDGSLAKKPHVFRQCQVCGAWVSTSEITVDHIDPVISVEDGFQGWDVFVSRLWCSKENLQRICTPCARVKNNKERFGRMFKEELLTLNDLTSGIGASPEIIKEFVSDFTPKRLAKFPYPQDFKDRIVALRRSFNLKV